MIFQVKKEDKIIVNNRKQKIITECRKELGLLLDCPRKNYGTTNTGNAARKFFDNVDTVSRITGQFHKIYFQLIAYF